MSKICLGAIKYPNIYYLSGIYNINNIHKFLSMYHKDNLFIINRFNMY